MCLYRNCRVFSTYMWSRQIGRYKSLTGCFHQILTSVETEFVNLMFGERDAELYDSIEPIDSNIMYLMHIASFEQNHKKSSKLGLIWHSKVLVNFIHIIPQVRTSFLPAIIILMKTKSTIMKFRLEIFEIFLPFLLWRYCVSFR